MNKKNASKIWKLIQEIGDFLKGKLPNHPNHSKGRNPYAHVALEVNHTEPGVKGNTATGATKPAILETNYTLNVPLFVDEGDVIKIDTRSGEYIERVKS